MTLPANTTSEVEAARAALIPCGRGEKTAKNATILVGGYTDIKVNDPEIFMYHLTALLAEYPADLVANALRDIPRTIPKYKFDLAGVRDFLEAEMSKRRAALDVAQAAHDEAVARLKEAQRRAQIEQEDRLFREWLVTHPGGTLRQYLELDAYTVPREHVYGPHQIGDIAGKIMGEFENG